MAENTLYYGDNLNILRSRTPLYIPDTSVDLVYLDPTFNRYASCHVPSAESACP